ncbi:MAG: tripartite tricarboxylate transporter substrate binding protein [Pseudolabrys sp.]|jgi:tripartite-type tricarboxylate transporter receptor subunit TctC|nr:tripartite tricarboxylate transporter substrate binding protein [Pseudolabrys sp.]
MRRAVLAAATLLMWATCAFPQDYPNRPIRIIVPTPAGGPVDVMARVLANALPPVLGQNVFVENKPGAGNTIGSRQAAVADPDGYTLMVSAASGLVMSPMIVKNAGYEASSFAPVVLVAETPQVLVINPQLSLKSVAELVAYAKDNPGKLNYSTGGIGTLPHLNAELFKSVSSTNILHVPYKGGGPSLMAVVAGEVQMTFDTVSTSLQLIQDGKLRPLAIVGPKRAPELPDVPAMPEVGFPAVTSGAWTALMAPRDTPPAVIARLNAATNAALGGDPMKTALAKLGAEPRGGTPQDLADHIQREIAKWKPIVATLNLKVD